MKAWPPQDKVNTVKEGHHHLSLVLVKMKIFMEGKPLRFSDAAVPSHGVRFSVMVAEVPLCENCFCIEISAATGCGVQPETMTGNFCRKFECEQLSGLL